MRWPHALLLLALPFGRAAGQSGCAPEPGAPSLDHAILVARDLDSAWARFAPLGFRAKAGRLHPDGLLNRHIKLRDHRGIELMTLAGEPGSAMAREYRTRLDQGEGGAYLALSVSSAERVARLARQDGRSVRVTRLGGWTFVSFPESPELGAVFFFSSAGPPPADPDSVLAHENGAVGLASGWVEGGPALERLLAALGAARCGTADLPDGRSGTRWALQRSAVMVIPPADGARTPRVVGVELETRSQGSAPVVHQPIPGFWIQLSAPRPP
ncbi:MAG: VOC family protein [Gemmatimonadales bacterium]